MPFERGFKVKGAVFECNHGPEIAWNIRHFDVINTRAIRHNSDSILTAHSTKNTNIFAYK